MRGKALLVASVVVAVGLAGCFDLGGRSCTIHPGDFTCQFGGSGDMDATETWQNNASRAEVTVQLGGSGNVSVTVLDDDGTQVLQMDVGTETGGAQETRTSEPGTPGSWTIELAGSYTGGLQVKAKSA